MARDVFEKTGFHSFKSGELCDGCLQCVRGEKLVLFVTGLCPRSCFYCPISFDKYGCDVVFANEWKVKDVFNPVELFDEVKMTGARGAGITGGEPLVKIDRVISYIKSLKEKFGEDFHIHLYTSLDLVNLKNLEKLHGAGLDEIRFHPDLVDDSLWDRVLLAKTFDWSVGVEVPVVPNFKENLFKLVNFLSGKVDFLNLNELEFSDTDSNHYDMSGFSRKNSSSYAVCGSEELAFDLLRRCAEINLRCHFCTAKLKNQVQVGERLKKRALNVASSVDELTEDYLLFRGAIYLDGCAPSFNYNQGSAQVIFKERLHRAREGLLGVGFEEDDLILDVERNRFLAHFSLVEYFSEKIKGLGLVPVLVEEYPSSDYFCVDLEFL